MQKRQLNISEEEESLLQDLKKPFLTIRSKTSRVPDDLLQQVDVLFDLRSEIYEDIISSSIVL